jgi:hypothetical protein
MLTLIRWFGLDTVFCVVAIQLFCQKLFGGVTYGYMVGLGVSTSLVYMIDRWVDGTLDPQSSSSRHIIYQQQKHWFIFSVILLLVACVYFWMHLVHLVKLRLMLGGLCFCFHLILLRFTKYSQFKLWVVAFIFSWVMLAGSPSMMMFPLLFAVTLLNLVVHDCIEKGGDKWALFIIVWLGCVIVSIQVLSGWPSVIFSIMPVLYVPLIRFANPLVIWFELGELIYALPFLVTYGLMVSCLK